VEVVLVLKLAILCSMADYSTTARQTLMLFVGGFWAWGQLANRIRYTSVVSKPMNSLSSVEGVLGLKPAIFYSTADY